MTDPAFWHPAEARPQIWRTLTGTVLVAVTWIATGLVLFWAGARASGLTLQEVTTPDSWATTAMFFLTFLGIHLGLLAVLPLLHRRRYRSLFGPSLRLHRGYLENGLLVTLAIAAFLGALMFVEPLFLPDDIAPTVTRLRPTGRWLLGLLPALALIFLQITAEEALFRGYLLQQLRARFRSPLIWAALPALSFGVLHYDASTYGYVNATAYVLSTTILGVIAAFVTLRTGNLGAAVGLHFGNNAAIVVLGPTGPLDGFSLWGAAMDPASGYTTYSIVTQTLVSVAVFTWWWRWMNRRPPIANRPSPA